MNSVKEKLNDEIRWELDYELDYELRRELCGNLNVKLDGEFFGKLDAVGNLLL